MSRAWGAALTFIGLSCIGCGSDDDSKPEDATTVCAHSPYNGLEAACDFEPGPGNGLSAPPAAMLPEPSGMCPSFVEGAGCVTETNGALTCTFQPQGEPPRDVRVWLPPGGGSPSGPLVFYYYGLLGFPDNAVTPFAGFTAEAQKLLFDAGGVLVAPKARPDREPPKLSRLPWIGALGFEDDPGDFLLADEVVACAIEKLGIDSRRIHVSGLSAGGWMTAQVAVRRSSYIASAVLFSGGFENFANSPDETNKYPVAMFHGGPNDFVGAHFENEAQSGVNLWRTLGHFAVNCNHGAGHSVPGQAALAGMQFLLDHPYGTLRSPYCQAAPPEFDFCALTTPATLGVLPATSSVESETRACRDATVAAGIAGASFSEDMLACACERCGTVLQTCLNDPDCLSGLQCGAQNGCLGVSCYQDALCAPLIDAAGGVVGKSPQLAVAFSDCVSAAACERCGVPERR